MKRARLFECFEEVSMRLEIRHSLRAPLPITPGRVTTTARVQSLSRRFVEGALVDGSEQLPCVFHGAAIHRLDRECQRVPCCIRSVLGDRPPRVRLESSRVGYIPERLCVGIDPGKGRGRVKAREQPFCFIEGDCCCDGCLACTIFRGVHRVDPAQPPVAAQASYLCAHRHVGPYVGHKRMPWLTTFERCGHDGADVFDFTFHRGVSRPIEARVQLVGRSAERSDPMCVFRSFHDGASSERIVRKRKGPRDFARHPRLARIPEDPTG
ncbi:MAG: hypothetical protein WCJ30_04245, partial [Deltaproteobacteria bacterium]